MNLKFIITLVFLLFSQILQAEITVNVDRNPVVANESFQLIFESDKKIKGEPDFSSLNKSFTVLNKGHRSNTQIINGDITQSHQWILTVIANKTGIIQIPRIHFGNEFSKPSQIKVVGAVAPKAGGKTDDVFIEVDVSNKTPYVQAQVIYTVKLYRAIQTSNSTLSEPEISGGQAVINKLGEDKSFETRVNGKRYVVIQRQYTLFPQSSGVLKIEPLIFQGQAGSSSFFGFDPFGPQPKSIAKRSDAIQLDVKPIPDEFTGDNWLPTNQLTIQEQWSVSPEKLKQGDATTRTLTLTANGLAASNLPTVDNHLPDNLKQYPDQPEFEETNDENGFVGIRREKMAIIPTEAGDYVLPAIKIPWWNTKTDRMEIAELPERKIHVAVSDSGVIDNSQQQKPIKDEHFDSGENNLQEEAVVVTEPVVEQTVWKWISLILFILWLFTLYMFWKSKQNSVKKENIDSGSLSSRYYLKQLKQACISNNAKETKQTLLDWARSQWPNENINSINSIKSFCNKELQVKIDELNAFLYGKLESQWNGADFLKSFESQSFEQKVSLKEKGKLEPLYKK
jgi:hypothetical protein